MVDKNKIDIMLCTKDRPTETALLLQSLRTQTYQNFDVFIWDDRSGQDYRQNYFLGCMFNRLKLEGHRVFVFRNEIKYGVTKLRQLAVDKIMEIGYGSMILRLDDDNLLEPDYIERLKKVLDQGYDIASGVVPHAMMPQFKRETKFVKPFIADIKLDDKGNILYFGDDCGMEYYNKEIIPSPHFRSMALMKKSVHEKVKYRSNIGYCSFREEEFFSFEAITKGFKIAVDTGAIAYHMQTPSGGERTAEFRDNLNFNHNLLNEYSKELYAEHGDYVKKYKESLK